MPALDPAGIILKDLVSITLTSLGPLGVSPPTPPPVRYPRGIPTYPNNGDLAGLIGVDTDLDGLREHLVVGATQDRQLTHLLTAHLACTTTRFAACDMRNHRCTRLS